MKTDSVHVHRAEQFNTLTHLLGAVLALSGAVLLVTFAAIDGDPWRITCFAIYGSTLFGLFLFSTLYHGLRGRAKSVFRRFDHCSIYFLIAGTYTPFMLVSLRGGWGWGLFGVVWGLAVFGAVQELTFARGARITSVVIYLAMGWLGVLASGPLTRALSPSGFLWVAAGGVLYTVGLLFYVLDEKYPYAHGIWHLFVLGGAGAHFFALINYVL